MIKKFVSNALMSVVMDKKARDKINALNEKRTQPAEDDDVTDIPRMLPERGKGKPAKPKSKSQATPRPAQTPAAPRPAAARPPSHLDEDDPAVLIREALASAEQELERKQNRTHQGKPITSERAGLIDQAMAIHRSKSHILDELDEDQRDKLTFMAMQALNGELKK